MKKRSKYTRKDLIVSVCIHLQLILGDTKYDQESDGTCKAQGRRQLVSTILTTEEDKRKEKSQIYRQFRLSSDPRIRTGLNVYHHEKQRVCKHGIERNDMGGKERNEPMSDEAEKAKRRRDEDLMKMISPLDATKKTREEEDQKKVKQYSCPQSRRYWNRSELDHHEGVIWKILTDWNGDSASDS